MTEKSTDFALWKKADSHIMMGFTMGSGFQDGI